MPESPNPRIVLQWTGGWAESRPYFLASGMWLLSPLPSTPTTIWAEQEKQWKGQGNWKGKNDELFPNNDSNKNIIGTLGYYLLHDFKFQNRRIFFSCRPLAVRNCFTFTSMYVHYAPPFSFSCVLMSCIWYIVCPHISGMLHPKSFEHFYI